MKSRNVYHFITIAFTCVVFAGCTPKPKEVVDELQPSPVIASLPPVTSVETEVVQRDACGKLTAKLASKVLGIQVGAPSVTQIVNPQSAPRNVCTYSRENDVSINVLTMTTSYINDGDPQKFQQLWDAQKNGATKVEGFSAEVYSKTLDGQSYVYALTSDAQYWLVMSKVNLSEAQQLTTLKKVVTELLK